MKNLYTYLSEFLGDTPWTIAKFELPVYLEQFMVGYKFPLKDNAEQITQLMIKNGIVQTLQTNKGVWVMKPMTPEEIMLKVDDEDDVLLMRKRASASDVAVLTAWFSGSEPSSYERWLTYPYHGAKVDVSFRFSPEGKLVYRFRSPMIMGVDFYIQGSMVIQGETPEEKAQWVDNEFSQNLLLMVIQAIREMPPERKRLTIREIQTQGKSQDIDEDLLDALYFNPASKHTSSKHVSSETRVKDRLVEFINGNQSAYPRGHWIKGLNGRFGAEKARLLWQMMLRVGVLAFGDHFYETPYEDEITVQDLMKDVVEFGNDEDILLLNQDVKDLPKRGSLKKPRPLETLARSIEAGVNPLIAHLHYSIDFNSDGQLSFNPMRPSDDPWLSILYIVGYQDTIYPFDPSEGISIHFTPFVRSEEDPVFQEILEVLEDHLMTLGFRYINRLQDMVKKAAGDSAITQLQALLASGECFTGQEWDDALSKIYPYASGMVFDTLRVRGWIVESSYEDEETQETHYGWDASQNGISEFKQWVLEDLEELPELQDMFLLGKGYKTKEWLKMEEIVNKKSTKSASATLHVYDDVMFFGKLLKDTRICALNPSFDADNFDPTLWIHVYVPKLLDLSVELTPGWYDIETPTVSLDSLARAEDLPKLCKAKIAELEEDFLRRILALPQKFRDVLRQGCVDSDSLYNLDDRLVLALTTGRR